MLKDLSFAQQNITYQKELYVFLSIKSALKKCRNVSTIAMGLNYLNTSPNRSNSPEVHDFDTQK